MKALSIKETLTLVHARPNAFTILMAKDGKMQTLGAMLPSDLADNQRLEQYRKKNLYFSINSFYDQLKWRKNIEFHRDIGLPLFHRREKDLSFLNAAVVDLDATDIGLNLPFEDLLGKAFELINQCGLPSPSLIADSGRNLWCLWLLRGPDGLPGHKAWPDRLETLKRINHALARTFAELGADPASVDGARVMRVPGSINTKTGRVVQFYQACDQRYGLHELAAALYLHSKKTSVTVDPGPDKDQKRSDAARRRWANEAARVTALCDMRKGFKEGEKVRHLAHYYLAALLRKSGCPRTEIKRQMQLLNSKCAPPLASRELERIWDQARKNMGWIRPATLKKQLRMTEREIEALWLRQLTREQRNANRASIIAQRRQVARKLQEQHPHATLEQLLSFLKQQHEIEISRRTLVSDLKGHHAIKSCMSRSVAYSTAHTELDCTVCPSQRKSRRQALLCRLKSKYPTASVQELKLILATEGYSVSCKTIMRDLRRMSARLPAEDDDPSAAIGPQVAFVAIGTDAADAA